nr:MAM and LDL-receptor class A domain-containing protein 1-like [Lytechinus pictus]
MAEMLSKQVSCLLMSVFVLLLKQTGECLANIEVKFAGSCDFETDDLCGYVQGDRDDFNWKRRTGPTPSRGTGPDYDHTLRENGTGHYAFIEGTGVHAWNAAHLISPSLAPLPTYCVTFFYHMYGDDTGELSLRVLDDSQPEKLSEELWTMLWEQGNRWFNVSVDVPCDRGCKLSFEAKPGNGYWSDTAIDDITVVNGSCFPIEDPSTLRPSTTTTGTSTKESKETSTLHPSMETSTHPSPHSTLDYQIIEYKYDERFITIILAVGLTFWSVVFIIIFIIFCYCEKRQNGGRPRGMQYDVTMDSPHPEKQSANMATYVEIDEQEREHVESVDGGDGDIVKLKDRSEAFCSDESSLDSERYSVPFITTPKPPRGPSPCGYMSLQLDSLNNNGNTEYQPLSTVDLTEVPA